MPRLKLARRNVKTQARKKRVRLFFRFAFVFIAAFSALSGLRYLSLHVEKLKLGSVLVWGDLTALSSYEILEQSKLEIGEPLFAIDLNRVVEKIQESPWVKFVKVTRRFPHELDLEVREKQPKLILNAGNQLYWVSEEAQIIQNVNGHNLSADLPVLTGLSKEQMMSDPPRSREILFKAIELADRYEQHSFYSSLGLSEIHYDKGEGFSVFPETKPFKALVGFDDFEVKLGRLANALDKLRALGKDFASIDLNYESRAILTL